MMKNGESMINFYVERQPDDLLNVLFFEEDNLLPIMIIGTNEDRIDQDVINVYPHGTLKNQILEKPNVI